MGMKRGRKKYATTWQKKVYFIDRSPFSPGNDSNHLNKDPFPASLKNNKLIINQLAEPDTVCRPFHQGFLCHRYCC